MKIINKRKILKIIILMNIQASQELNQLVKLTKSFIRIEVHPRKIFHSIALQKNN